MSNKIKKIVLLMLGISTLNLAPAISKDIQTEQIVSEQVVPEQIRDQIEEMITCLRQETEQVGLCVQQLIQTLQANKLSVTEQTRSKLHKNLLAINEFIAYLLKNEFLATNPSCLDYGFIVNNSMIKYMIEVLDRDITTLNFERMQQAITIHINKHTKLTAALFDQIKAENKNLLEKLLHKADFIGLSWYNIGYRFLKEHNAYAIARGTAAVAGAALLAACVYQNYAKVAANDPSKNWLQHKIAMVGMPPESVDFNGVSINKPGTATGLFKLWDLFQKVSESVKNPWIVSACTAMYAPYAYAAMRGVATKADQLDSALAGTKGKYDVGDYEKVYFKNMVGAEHLEGLAKQIADYLQHPERYERTQTDIHRGILLYGPPQTGKTLFAKALCTMISETKNIRFIDAKMLTELGLSINDVFAYAKSMSPCILFIDEIDLVAGNREKSPWPTGQLLTNMQGVDMVNNKVFIIAATNRMEQIDKALLADGRFGKQIYIGYPKYQHRKEFLAKELSVRGIRLDDNFVDYMAQESEGASYNKLRRLITEALNLSAVALRPVSQDDFEKILDVEVRKIEKQTIVLSSEEKRVIAIYQAGKALMRHLLQTKQQVAKITILPVAKQIKQCEYGWSFKTDQTRVSDNEKHAKQSDDSKMKDGDVFTKASTTNNSLISDQESKKECLCLLAGYVAHELLLHQTFSRCNPQDRADAMQLMYAMISQGETIDKETRIKALEIKEKYEVEITKILQKHIPMLEKIAQKLIDQNSINQYEWAELIKGYATVA